MRTQSLEARWAVLDGGVGLLWWLWRLRHATLHVGLVHGVELFERGGAAVGVDGVAQAVVPAEVRQVQEVAGIAPVHEDFCLLREYLPPGLAQQRCCVFQVRLEVPCRHGLPGE